MNAICSASFDELRPRTAYLLWQLRAAVFVVEQECAYLDLDGRDLEPGTRHLWIEETGQPVAYLRLLDGVGPETGPETGPEPGPESGAASATVRIGRVVVAPSHRGRGLGRALMDAALAEVGERRCRLDAQSYLVTWYRMLGFEPCGAEFLEDGIPHVPMLRVGQSSRSLA